MLVQDVVVKTISVGVMYLHARLMLQTEETSRSFRRHGYRKSIPLMYSSHLGQCSKPCTHMMTSNSGSRVGRGELINVGLLKKMKISPNVGLSRKKHSRAPNPVNGGLMRD